MITIRFDEYAFKKHLFAVFVCLMAAAIAFVLVQGERMFGALFALRAVRGETLATYRSIDYRFSVSYPADYTIGEGESTDGFSAYFVRQQEPPFYAKFSPILVVSDGDRAGYLEGIAHRADSHMISTRNVTVGGAIFAKEVVSRIDGTDARLKETVFGNAGRVYVIMQQYEDRLDPAYPLLVKTFEFQ